MVKFGTSLAIQGIMPCYLSEMKSYLSARPDSPDYAVCPKFVRVSPPRHAQPAADCAGEVVPGTQGP